MHMTRRLSHCSAVRGSTVPAAAIPRLSATTAGASALGAAPRKGGAERSRGVICSPAYATPGRPGPWLPSNSSNRPLRAASTSRSVWGPISAYDAARWTWALARSGLAWRAGDALRRHDGSSH